MLVLSDFILIEGMLFVLTVIVRLFENIGLWLAQLTLLIISQLTTSLFTNTFSLYIDWFAPTLTPFFFHWYIGDPPFVGIAVKSTVVPSQILVWLASILMDGTTIEFIVIVIRFELTILGDVQAIELVKSQEMTSLFAKVLSV